MTQHHFIQSVQGQKSIRETLSLVLFLVDDLNNATQNSKNFGTFKFIPEKQPKELKDLTQVSFNAESGHHADSVLRFPTKRQPLEQR